MEGPQDLDEVSRRDRKLQLRNARFRGPLAPPRNFTPPSAARFGLSVYARFSGADSSPLPMTTALSKGSVESSGQSSDDEDILQEISNSSLRRQGRVPEELKNRSIYTDSTIGHRSIPAVFADSPADSRSANSLRPPPRSDLRRQYRVSPRSSKPRRKVSGETPKYIESLETNIAALHAQLQTFTSPTSAEPSRSKARAMSSEIRLLRQEVKEWEETFADKVQEQQEHSIQVSKQLKSRLRSLERDIQFKEQRTQELEVEVENISSSLQVAEEANYDLERRLEFMSELVATSPSKPSWHTDEFRGARRKSQAPSIVGTPRASLRNSLISPDRSRASARRQTTDMNTFHSPSRRDSAASNGPSRDSGYSTERTSDVHCDSNIVSPSDYSPSRPVSWARSSNADLEQRNKPGKRGRRFYPGSAVQSLILPSTQQHGDYPASAPMLRKLPSFPQTPTVPSADMNIDDHETRSQRSQSTHLSPNQEARDLHDTPRATRNTTPKMQQDSHALDGIDDDDNTTTALGLSISRRVVRVSQGRNLFDELESFQTRAKSRSHSLTTPIKHLDDVSSNDTPSSSSSQSEGLDHHPPTLYHPSDEIDPTEVIVNPVKEDKKNQGLTVRLGVQRMLAFISMSINAHSFAARRLFGGTWDGMAMSKHVLEFRCWLIRLLIGKMRSKGLLTQLRKPKAPRPIAATSANLGLGLGCAPLSGPATTILDPQNTWVSEDYLLEALSDDRQHIPPFAPPMNWARFSMTLVCAVSIAIKDGPASLFIPSTPLRRPDTNDLAYGKPGVLDSP